MNTNHDRMGTLWQPMHPGGAAREPGSCRLRLAGRSEAVVGRRESAKGQVPRLPLSDALGVEHHACQRDDDFHKHSSGEVAGNDMDPRHTY